MRSFKGASLRCGRPAMNNAEPKQEFNRNALVRSGLGITLQDKTNTDYNGAHTGNSYRSDGLPLQKSRVHHVDGQKCVVQRTERGGVETDRCFLGYRRWSVLGDRFDQRLLIGRCHFDMCTITESTTIRASRSLSVLPFSSYELIRFEFGGIIDEKVTNIVTKN